jgi:SAM-dependent methyltransferase
MKTALYARNRVLAELPVGAFILDVGSGSGEHSHAFERAGHVVYAIDPGGETPNSIRDPDETIPLDHFVRRGRAFDCVWASHVLEHAPDVNDFITRLRWNCLEGGLLAITVPPMKPQIVGGHINLFNAGLLLYRLVYNGLDCSEAKVGRYGYNISVLVRNIARPTAFLHNDAGDVETLRRWFPYEVFEGFDGDAAAEWSS